MRLSWLTALTGVLLATAGHPAMAREAVRDRITIPLNNGWSFRPGGAQSGEGPAAWTSVTLPHSWNRVGDYDRQTGITRQGPPIDKRQGLSTYQLDLGHSPLRAGERAWLQFDAVSRSAKIWVNGTFIGRHDGGFSRFRFDITDALKTGDHNIVLVEVDNTQPAPGAATADILPLTGDFFVYGGIYRPASLIVTRGAQFDLLDAGGPGVYARTTALTATGATVDVKALLRSQSVTGPYRVTVRLVDAKGQTAASGGGTVSLKAGATASVFTRLHVPHPRLWQGVAAPNLYTLVAELRDTQGNRIDRVVQDFGIRQMRLDPQRGFILNGKPYPLHGVALHQGTMTSGWAASDAEIARVFNTVRDMGANALRLSHYQHGETIHRLADRAGVVLWDEVPLVTAWTVSDKQTQASPGLLANARQQLRELITQNSNHAAVAVWGIANEVDFGPNRPGFLNNGTSAVPDPMPLLRNLNSLAHDLDPSRPTALATCCEHDDMPGVPLVAGITDTSGANRYYGWYYGQLQDLGTSLDTLHAKRPDQPLAVTEYGAGGGVSLHTDNPEGGPIDAGGHKQPEEYQALLHEESWKQLAQRPYLWATWVWNGFDFSSVARHEGDATDINTKGLISFDGSIKKDAFYFYRAQWSSAPTVHITGRRYVDRAYGVNDVKVYSNAPFTRLTLNGRALGERRDCPQHVCLWQDVKLASGANALSAIGSFAGHDVTDSVSWVLAPSQVDAFRIDAGSVIAAPSRAGHFGSDAFFVGGTAGTADLTPRYRPPTLVKIEGSPDRDLLATYREGEFAYHLPLRPGTYRVTLDLVEPSAAPGERIFDVTANGRPMIEAMDIATAAGGKLKAIQRSFTVQLDTPGLALGFATRKGKAIVSALSVERMP
ncbi:MAG: glycoside hydrolase family 2 [Sphingomonadales bacterium]|nr:glycoside hydrolase family 2 [Sphingomonadales bacterium]MDE2170613.1 glycoside hydrolase family 2 [Sphingomonadales bacterium]